LQTFVQFMESTLYIQFEAIQFEVVTASLNKRIQEGSVVVVRKIEATDLACRVNISHLSKRCFRTTPYR
jgi:hypothetical protein